MQYPDSVEYLYALGNEMKSAKLGLERMQALLEELGNPQQRFRVVHVAGTNGKGSTCAMIAAGLQANGMHTGLCTSPHLLEPTERIRIAGVDVTREVFVEAFRAVHVAAEAMLARGELDAHPSYFETVTAMGFWAFAQAGVQWAVVEVGLGGRLDATNVVRPDLAVITPVDFDHEAWLGRSIESIAAEKAGILKSGVPALTSIQRPEALRVLKDRAHAVDTPLHHSASWRQEALEVLADGVRFVLHRKDASPADAPLVVECPLRGAFQAENARTAAAALDLLGVPTSKIEAGIRQVRWPGRLEQVGRNPDVFLDGAHNPAGCAALAAYIRQVKGNRKVWLVFGIMRDKAISEMTSELFPLADRLVLTAPSQPRALRPEVLAAEAGEQPHVVAADVEQAIAAVRNADPDDIVFIAGSLFLVAEAAALLCTRNPRS
ncbi:MAG: bifunctional folylpolyglutamate synthase/dihydrofolate synthase [Bryobacterales bacterium]|nr:bifunctional folylpolyglutamate synthase/dihydrofolate synthase [Bryobacterales bacterium]